METESDPGQEPQESADEPTEATGALNEDNPKPPEDAGQKGAGAATDAIGGLEGGSEPHDEDARDHERP
ncbi:MAG: hypothetical protein QOK00_1137 [Thermoleophilaceae bacterium]|jgi:hypothetical protein|nr:hypothetical protein [Thermoleophilaceae bacterium]MEA2400734.1 hypothetical protein [Thermoleophilaceae bacterium]